MSNKYDPTAMNEAAAAAAADFPTTGMARDVAVWWDRWFLKAGHKRLAYVLMSAYGLRKNRYLQG